MVLDTSRISTGTSMFILRTSEMPAGHTLVFVLPAEIGMLNTPAFLVLNRYLSLEPTLQDTHCVDRLLFQNSFSSLHDAVAHFGQLLVVTILPPGSAVDTVQAMEMVQGLLQAHGALFAFFREQTFMDGSFRAIAEFCNPSAALIAMASCNGLTIEVSFSS